ncbi:hypothetical protein CRG98_027718 [Punica granatum]|uniref:Zinc finger, CCHC-type n=1 Tax=Punica granatum TaxID=22663 RepID=A0A2I0J6L1_PUNGR|nr:hypothetical protein CRG98_027718 [Punica granatum]
MCIRAQVLELLKMSDARFKVEKFDGTNDFRLWKIKMKTLLFYHYLEGALGEDDKLNPTLTTDVKALLNSKKLQKKVTGYRGSDGEGLIVRGNLIKKGSPCRSKSRRRKRTSWICYEEGHLKLDYQKRKVKASTNIRATERSDGEGDVLSVVVDRGTRALITSAFERSTSEEKYLGDLDHDRVNGCRKAEKARHLGEVQGWLGLERHACKVRSRPVGVVTEQSSGRLIMLG